MGVEKYNAGTPLVLDQLHGTWLLQYTTASEIVSLIQAADQFPLLQVKHVALFRIFVFSSFLGVWNLVFCENL